jgi:hypothetical protein
MDSVAWLAGGGVVGSGEKNSAGPIYFGKATITPRVPGFLDTEAVLAVLFL